MLKSTCPQQILPGTGKRTGLFASPASVFKCMFIVDNTKERSMSIQDFLSSLTDLKKDVAEMKGNMKIISRM